MYVDNTDTVSLCVYMYTSYKKSVIKVRYEKVKCYFVYQPWQIHRTRGSEGNAKIMHSTDLKACQRACRSLGMHDVCWTSVFINNDGWLAANSVQQSESMWLMAIVIVLFESDDDIDTAQKSQETDANHRRRRLNLQLRIMYNARYTSIFWFKNS